MALKLKLEARIEVIKNTQAKSTQYSEA